MHDYASEKFGELVLGAAACASLGAGRRGHEDVVADRQRLGECLQRNEPVGRHDEKRVPLWWLPRRLVQTYCREDHRVRTHAGYFAREFDRTYVDDGQQYAEFCNFASTQSVNLFLEYIKPRHRDLHMYRRGGVYLDFKCGLLQPLWSWLLELQNACMQHELGRHDDSAIQACKQGERQGVPHFLPDAEEGCLNKLEPGWVDAGPYGWVLKEDKLVTDKALQVMQLTKPIPDTDGPFVSLPFDGHIIHSKNKHPAQTEHWLLATRCWGWNQGWKEDRARADTAFHQAGKGHRVQASAAQVVACRPLDGDLAVEMQVLRLSEAGRVSNLVCCK